MWHVDGGQTDRQIEGRKVDKQTEGLKVSFNLIFICVGVLKLNFLILTNLDEFEKKKLKIWENFHQVSNEKTKCKICNTNISNSNGSTGALINNMKTIHGIMVIKLRPKDGEPALKK